MREVRNHNVSVADMLAHERRRPGQVEEPIVIQGHNVFQKGLHFRELQAPAARGNRERQNHTPDRAAQRSGRRKETRSVPRSSRTPPGVGRHHDAGSAGRHNSGIMWYT